MKILIAFLSLLLPSLCLAQYKIEPVFPSLNGDALIENVIDTYKPNFVLDLSEAKDTLYKSIYLENGSVSCVYSGLSKVLNLNEDPSQNLFQNGGNGDINLEHSFPQSKGASSGNANSDMHHLFPTRVPVNSARGSDPFRELPDNETESWFFNDQTISQIPNQNIELYSEDTNNGFEPREDFKGNIARAQFYFYTMYKDRADIADPGFFQGQVETLCEWHFSDPVDSLEWGRTFKIASYQDGSPNPFVLDCRLARIYCPQVGNACLLLNNQTVEDFEFKLFPNVVSPNELITIEFNTQEKIQLNIFNIEGRLIKKINQQGRSIKTEAPNASGIYIILVESGVQKMYRKLVVH